MIHKTAREGNQRYSSLSLPPTHKHWNNYLSQYNWDIHLELLMTAHEITWLLLKKIYHGFKLILISTYYYKCKRQPKMKIISACYMTFTIPLNKKYWKQCEWSHAYSATNKSRRVESSWFKPSFNNLMCLVDRSHKLVFL